MKASEEKVENTNTKGAEKIEEHIENDCTAAVLFTHEIKKHF
jgi:hypothetical protein